MGSNIIDKITDFYRNDKNENKGVDFISGDTKISYSDVEQILQFVSIANQLNEDSSNTQITNELLLQEVKRLREENAKLKYGC